MCGIVAMVVKASNGLSKKTEDSFYQMLYADTLRGDDSTGIIGVDKDTSFHIAKEATEATWFIDQYRKSAKSREMWQSGKAMIGHNRKKTVGEIKDETAHPFVVNEEFAMVHNGTLFGHKSLADTEVDSEALAIHLHKAFTEGTKEVLDEALGKVNGAYATVSYDQRSNKVHFLRNRERPLAMIETHDAWFFASESPMLFWILARNGYAGKELEGIKQIPENTLFTIDLDTNKTEVLELEPKKPYTPMTAATGVTITKATTKSYPAVTGGMSKQQFKRFQSAQMGSNVEFWAEDFVERNFPRTVADDGETAVTLIGAADSFLCDHIINADVDIKDLNLSIDVCTERRWQGKITMMRYDKRTKRVVIKLDGAVPLPISAKGQKEGVHIEYHGTVCKAITYNGGIIVQERIIDETSPIAALY